MKPERPARSQNSFTASANALTVLQSRYLWKSESGAVSETPDQLIARVAAAIATNEKRNRGYWEDRFFDVMIARRFLPNTPTLINAGRPNGQLSACFVLEIEDSLESIFDSLKAAAMIHQSGGGTGFAFSRIRPRGSTVRSTSGIASGPVSFMKIFDTATETIKQGGARRGANMAVLRVDHPDIKEFINSKRDLRSVTNFNISVGITDDFMRAVEASADFSLVDPRTRKEVRRASAKALWEEILQAAWECGDPGLVFLDRINVFNPTPELGPMESTNPCGEQPLLPYESCNLGSLNLGEYFQNGEFGWGQFQQDISVCVRFLDNVIDVNSYPVDECRKITLRNRKIGLGVMGFADVLLMLGLPYNSAEARGFGEKVMSVLDREAKACSAQLARERGAFSNWKGSLWHRLGYPELRNATVSTVAPTGTISIIAGASSGIEPVFSGFFYRNVLSGARLVEIHPAVERAFKNLGKDLGAQVTDASISSALGPAWTPAKKVSVMDHVRMQAVFQRHSDSAVSKTINMPESATRAEIGTAYRAAYAMGCKGITVYRDRSRPVQVLEGQEGSNGEAEVCSSC